MKESNFFEKQTLSSKIKASIISEYFPSYCKIIVKQHAPKEIRYVDLFAGPGKYKDGNDSTPLLIAKKCRDDEFLRLNVKMLFNDSIQMEALEKNFNNEIAAGTFPKPPFFANREVGQSEEITKFLVKYTHIGKYNECPSLLFIDPFGYKGIETKVLAEFLKNWGNEIFLFVNTKRIHPALENEKFEGLMESLFPTTFQKIKQDRKFKATVSQRLNLIINSLGEEYESILKTKIYYTAFKFQEEDNDATSHYILHLTKGVKGYELIKTIYNDFANVGTIFEGNNTYTFDAKKYHNPLQELFDIKSMNIDKLKEDLFAAYKGKKINALQLFNEHHRNVLYTRSHYTEALARLVDRDRLKVTFTDNKQHRKPVIVSETCILEFKNG